MGTGPGAGGAAVAGDRVRSAQEQKQAAPFAPGAKPAAVPADGVRQAVDATAAGLKEQAPEPAAVPMTEQQKQLQGSHWEQCRR